MEKTAILFGASGLIGESLLKQLLDSPDYKEVLIVLRKKIDLQHAKLKQLLVDFDRLDDYKDQLYGEVVFCCLGSTKSKTPNLSQYKKIDYQYPLDAARITQSNGANQYHLVSAIGANPDSNVFYSRTKGELERDLKSVSFESLYIYRPSLLDGKRKEKRIAESVMIRIMRVINPLLNGKLKKYRSIKIEDVAAAMLKKSITSSKGIFIYPSNQIQEIADKA